MLSQLKRNLINIPGWSSNQKIVVFESDDWGAIRLPDISKMEIYRNQNPKISNPYLKYDSLASSDDLNNLFSVLRDFKDIKGNHPVFTFNTVVANPDFERIKESGYNQFFYEPFTETLKKFSNHSQSFNLWKKAIDEKLMYPQFHGREHVNVPIWLKELRDGNQDLLNAFELGTWSSSQNKIKRINLQASLDWEGVWPKEYQEAFIKEGLSLFEAIFGFKSRTMIPNNFILGVELHEIIKQNGIEVIQGMKYQKLPLGDDSSKKRKMIRRYLGSENKENLKYFVRNCHFEPSQTSSIFDDVNQCLNEISIAFFWNKPAIINTHRLNYIGVYDIKNRDQNLLKLRRLINEILIRWPDVEFLNSQRLTDIVK
jgi:hypothetical protein